MDRARIALMRDLLAGTGWVERTRSFGQALRRAPHEVGGLLLGRHPDRGAVALRRTSR